MTKVLHPNQYQALLEYQDDILFYELAGHHYPNTVEPSLAQHVQKELEIITSEFPFLDITATIYDNCISEDSKKPLFSFKLKDGKLEESNEHLSSSHMYMLQMNI